MDWFKRKKETLQPVQKKELPDGLWVKCDGCSEIIFKKELDKRFYVCPHCDLHMRVSSDIYISLLMDKGSFREFNKNIKSTDPLNFKDFKQYSERYKATVKKTGLNEAVITGTGNLDKHKVIMSIMDFRFLGGSMGSVVGEKISRAVDKSLK
jgi:acetyl-CoA carboxylase carboxyl transferase subunit beta